MRSKYEDGFEVPPSNSGSPVGLFGEEAGALRPFEKGRGLLKDEVVSDMPQHLDRLDRLAWVAAVLTVAIWVGLLLIVVVVLLRGLPSPLAGGS